MSGGTVQQRAYVDPEPVVAIGPRWHALRAHQPLVLPAEDRLGLDDVVLDAARDRDDLLDPPDAVRAGAEVERARASSGLVHVIVWPGSGYARISLDLLRRQT
jgi:hypothetical protein